MLAPPGMHSTPAAELREFLATCAPRVRGEWGDDQSLQARLAWQRALNEGGWAAPGWPVQYGGRGLGVRDRVQLVVVAYEAGVVTPGRAPRPG